MDSNTGNGRGTDCMKCPACGHDLERTIIRSVFIDVFSVETLTALQKGAQRDPRISRGDKREFWERLEESVARWRAGDRDFIYCLGTITWPPEGRLRALNYGHFCADCRLVVVAEKDAIPAEEAPEHII